MPAAPALPAGMSVLWLGHSTFLVTLPNGKRLLLDPWTTGNPACPPDKKDVGPVDLMLITHGHSDHISDAAAIAIATNCQVVCIFEIMLYLTEQGVPAASMHGMNKGGSVALPEFGVTVTMTHAIHSSGIDTSGGRLYGGEAAGLVITLDDGYAFYFAGDTALFSDMALIAELYSPKLAFLPIGDRFTMGPREAARAVQYLSGVEMVVPMHYGTFPMLTGTPDSLKSEMMKMGVMARVLTPEPGEEVSA